ncbi:MAG: PIG-L family deacetylase [Patescibacteria group bacterium]|nr:PIG-L family deacetylase [Patescibacteria group bacterium]
MNPQKFSALTPKIVLGVAAHPDDLDFGASGAMAAFAAQGAAVYYLLLTDGSKGSADYHASTVDLIKTRQAEQRAAIQAIGAKDVKFLDYPDGELEVTMDVKRDIVREIRTIRPDVVITMDPSVLYSAEQGMINHPDHRAAGQATLDAVYPLARDHLSMPELFAEGYEPHKVATLLLINFNEQNFTVDISQTIDLKLKALEAHASQMPDVAKTQAMVRDIASGIGAKSGYQFGEGYIRIDIPA